MYQAPTCVTLSGMRRIATIAILCTVALSAACSSASGSAEGPPSSTAASTPASVAAQLGCTNVTASTGQREMYTKATATCTLNGSKYLVDTFASTADRDAFVKVAKQMGALGDYKSGPDWVAYPV